MKKIQLFLGDIAALYASLAIVLMLRYDRIRLGEAFSLHLLPFTIIFGIWVLILYIANLYEIHGAKNDARFFSTFIYVTLINAFVALAFFYLIPFFGIAPKTNLFLFIILYAVLGLSWRLLFNTIIGRNTQSNNTLIVGDSEQSQELHDFLVANRQLGYRCVGIINIKGANAVQDLKDIVREKRVRTLVLEPSVYKIPHIIDLFYGLVDRGMFFYPLSDFYERVTAKIPLGAIDQIWFLQNLSEGRKHGYEMFKRVFDVVFASVVGLISLIIYPLIIVAIKLDSRGPVLFRQRRVGKAGQVFTLIKFRNMVANSPDGSAEGATGPVWASANDPRVTRVGRFIRTTRIDELPQLWNVLRGDMSFIGPRPERPEFHEKLKSGIPFYEERYLIKPGLTGWAQIKYKLDFKGGMTIQDTAEKLQYDLFYIKNRSIFLDAAIILKTIGKLLMQEGK